MNEYIANRMNGIDASGIRKVFDLAAKMEHPINLSIGQPHFDVPDPVKKAANEAVLAGKNRYTPTQGIEPLRNALRKELLSEFGWSDAMERPMLITSGVSGALKLAFAVTINPGDEVILFDPYFVMYKHLTALYGGVPVLVDTYPDFTPKSEDIEKAITSKTKIICLNSPCNPTGQIYTKECLKAIADIARKHNILVISDEIYNFYCYDDKFESMAKYYEKTLLMRGFSKSHSMTGWRMGWVTGPKDVVEKMTILQQYSFVCAPSVAQEATLVALKTNMDDKIADYKVKRDLVYNGLKDKFNLVCPHGAFYAFVPVPESMTATDFVTKAIQNNVLLIPGNVFSSKDTHFRLSFAAKDEDIKQGIDILNSLV
ncbi:MAG: aminotransferase class I/II-fold pyridoxal phosphate-dependent enzyme [Candidatus Sumerlaeales bacterium]|nr:aminotransferase class I/II-fold pyridoxal phosphate-dependent enzyme [Candidatus Sumerlaeales bacterium]